MKFLRLLGTFEGRIGRGEFWLAVAIYTATVFVTIAMSLALDSFAAIVALQLTIAIPLLISLVAVGIKRLHDRNKSTWWLLLFYLLPALFVLLPSIRGGDPDTIPTAVVVLVYLGFAALLWGVIELGFIRGTIGGNPHGPDPVAPRPAQH
jgi:uncharacterized membrane protein YhaH (DUF805 family)